MGVLLEPEEEHHRITKHPEIESWKDSTWQTATQKKRNPYTVKEEKSGDEVIWRCPRCPMIIAKVVARTREDSEGAPERTEEGWDMRF